ncbi:MAG: UDP-N-acetylglucosamine 2-epimerase (non-hydrolyzing) [Candidatus Pacebacteria bacterium]|nr:UDP-N-acetylglucosamine 2-epimerase (non-hydrolyzing) [Candidatus Paceibacterota bacterium]
MIHIILGTRAQLIKMMPVMKELQNRKMEYNFIFLAEHKETISSILKEFHIKSPDIIIGDLNKDITNIITMISWSLSVLVYTIINKKKIFKNNRKGIVLVHGDAPPCLLGALMAKVANLKVGHIESGLRSFNLFNPFPEEVVRILTFNLCDYFFCPNKWAIMNLKKYKGLKINTNGNTLLDSLRLALKENNEIYIKIPKTKYCIVSIHRFENIFNRERLENIIRIIENIAKQIKILFVLHPPTKKNLEKFNFLSRLDKNNNIELRPRYSYFNFIKLLYEAEFIVTDGGSNQEESYYLGKPCLVMRKTTERKEGLDKNVVISKYDKKIIEDFINNYQEYKSNSLNFNISPSKIIVDYLEKLRI